MPDKILLIDDNSEFRGMLKSCLEEYDVVEASSGEEAIRLLKKPNDIDLVILDVVMPGLNGIEAMQEIKTTSPEIGIIILTGYSSKDTAIEALRHHADEYIEKPPDIDKTKEVIEKVLDAKRFRGSFGGLGRNSKIEKIKLFLEKNCYKKICLKDAALAVHLSPKYLSRIFKQEAKMGFNQFRLGIKIEKAKELLRSSGFNVNQISDKMGYQNVESFIRCFKNATRCTPAQYRKKVRPKQKTKR